MPGKTKRQAFKPTTLAFAVAAAFSPLSSQAEPPANQLPTNGSIVGGSSAGSISTNGNKMQIDQYGDRMIGKFDCFCIGSSAWVNVNQPSASSVALFKSLQAAEIFGKLSANGQVFISSSAGVYFGRTAQVDVGGLLATNLSIRDQDFQAGRYIFSNEGSSGSVVNDGTIVTPSGYAALAGTQVRNNGIIVANAGTVALAAGDRVSLDMIGDGLIKVSVDAAALNALALNAGTIQADGGRVVLTARSANALLDTVVNNTGVIRANTLVERNGEIVLDGGSAGVVVNSGTLTAAGEQAGTTGGSVKVTGQHVYLTEGSSIEASGASGGGTVVVKGTDTAYFRGSISARGTGEGASGGMVETSGGYLEIGQAPEVGAGGTWLIDPYNITVVAGAGTSNNAGSPSFTPGGDDSQIGNILINNQLNAGANVILDTGGPGSPGAQAGDITVNAAIVKSVVNGASLTLNANNNIAINDNVLMLNGAITINAGGNVSLNAAGGKDAVVSGTSQTVTAQGLSLSARDGRRAVLTNTGGNQNITTGAGGVNLDVLNGAGVAQISNTAIGGNQTVSTTGSLTVVGGSAGASTNSGLFTNGAGGKQTVVAGSITLQGATTGNNGGAFISNTASGGDQEVTVNGGSIAITAGANGLANRAGIVSNGNQTISGNPNITVTGGASGTGTGAASNAAFIQTSGAGKQQTINAGSLTLVAGAGGTDTSATVTAGKQTITTIGDVLISGGGGGGDANGARIGGLGGAAPSATDLTLNVGRDLIISGGPANGASIGSTVTAATPHTIAINAARDVILNASANGGVRIGTSFNFATPAAGDIAISAGRDIQLNGAGQGAAIRTAGNVSLTAGGSISENQFNAQILANALSSNSGGTTDLTGDNRLSFYGGSTTGGDLLLHNAAPLTINAPVSSAGALQLTVDGGLTISASGTQDAIVTSRNGQTVTADSLALHAQDGRRAVLQNIVAGGQTVTIGSGGIDLDVVGGAGVAQIASSAANGNQLVTTSGALNVVGGSAAPSTSSGIFLAGSGAGTQSVSAASITLTGASTGANGGAFINNTQGDQIVTTTGDLTISAGAGGNAGITGALGRQQSVSANNISITNAASGGFNSVGFILGSHQQITAAGNVTLTSRGSGGDLAGTRIGGGTGSATDLNLQVGGNLVLTGGSAPNNGAGIGSSAAGTALANDITINAGGDVILNAGSAAGSGVRIGSGPNGVAGGNLSITAANIQLNGSSAAPAAIRTSGDVTLHAGGSISESGNAFIQGNSLLTTSQGDTSLGGQNQVAMFTGDTAAGNISLRNSSSLLTLGTMSFPGSLSIDQTGALAVPGTVTSQNQSISATGDVTIGRASGFGPAGLFAPGTITISTPQSIILRGSDHGLAGAAIVAGGGLVTLNAGEVHLTGGAAPLAAASVLSGNLVITSARDISLTAGSGWQADALLYSRNNINMTVGGILTINGGQHSWARVQTERRNARIDLYFPNRHSGGYFVDGFEGKIKHGDDGIFTGDKAAKLGQTLFVRYGL